jgi:hypothetical protein
LVRSSAFINFFYFYCVRAVQMTLSVTMVAAGWDSSAALFEPE